MVLGIQKRVTDGNTLELCDDGNCIQLCIILGTTCNDWVSETSECEWDYRMNSTHREQKVPFNIILAKVDPILFPYGICKYEARDQKDIGKMKMIGQSLFFC